MIKKVFQNTKERKYFRTIIEPVKMLLAGNSSLDSQEDRYITSKKLKTNSLKLGLLDFPFRKLPGFKPKWKQIGITLMAK
jgi:hypothetical protein